MESTVRNVWVDHVTLEASGGESEGFDGLFDMKDNTQYVTLSYSTLRNSGRGGLVGSSESDLSNGFITYHHNLYENIDSRTPLLRGGIAHIYNNYYVSLHESGINSRAGARAKVDNNYFKNSKDVLGTFYTDAGRLLAGQRQHPRQRDLVRPGSDNNPAGPNLPSNTTVSIPYSYSLDGASCVPNIVSQTAGANKGLQVSNGNCSPQHTDHGADHARAAARPPQPSAADHAGAHHLGAEPAQRDQPQHRCRLRRLQQGQRDELRQRARRQHEHLLVAGRLDRLHLDQVGLRHRGVQDQHP